MRTAESLTAAGIPCAIILDSAVAYAMEKVDFVLVGSEAVVESGGLINSIGTLNIGIIAKASNKPFYALAERSAISAISSAPFVDSLTVCIVINSTVFSHFLNTICRATTQAYYLFPHPSKTLQILPPRRIPARRARYQYRKKSPPPIQT